MLLYNIWKNRWKDSNNLYIIVQTVWEMQTRIRYVYSTQIVYSTRNTSSLQYTSTQVCPPSPQAY